MSELLIAIDVGNSRVKCGLFDRAEAVPHSHELPRCLHFTVSAVDGDIPFSEISGWVASSGSTLITAVIGGANPDGIGRVLDHWRKDDWPTPQVVEDPNSLPLEVHVAKPAHVGIDRLLNAVAANVIRPAGCPALVVSSGTATTVDSVSSDGAFLGGAILPGFELAARSLHQHTAFLPLISMEELANDPHHPLGTDTPQAMRSGLYWGQIGAVKELLERLGSGPSGSETQSSSTSSREASGAQPIVVLTGGGASLLADHLPGARWEPYLPLQGLALVATGSRDE